MPNAIMVAFGKARGHDVHNHGKFGKHGKEHSTEEELSESEEEATQEGDLDQDLLEAAKAAKHAQSDEEYARALHAFFMACSLAEKEKHHDSEEEGY